MILLLSGEGPTDIGQSERGGSSRGGEFLPGPMARLVEQILDPVLGYAILDVSREHNDSMVYFIDKPDLSERAREVRNPKSLLLTGSESHTGTLFHRKLAYTLGVLAREIEQEMDDLALAIFFRDSDGTQNCPRTDWQEKRDSIVSGFQTARFEGGVAMFPKPKSEAWLLCALRNEYRHCEAIEEESGNDNSPNNLKQQLENHLGFQPNRENLADLVSDGRIDARQITMPSFIAFLESLVAAAEYNGLDVSALQ